MNTPVRGLTISLCLILSFFVQRSYGGLVYGDNNLLPPDRGIFIPLSPETSGILGDDGTVGLVQDSVSLTGPGTFTEGFVTFPVAFQLNPDPLNPLVPAGQWIDPFATVLTVTFTDLDFMTYVAGDLAYSEWVSIAFIDAQDSFVGNVIVINETNWLNYLADPPPPTTNDVQLSYELAMFGDFGINENQAKALSLNQETVRVLLTLGGRLIHNGPGTSQVFNTEESLNENFMVFGVTPEPASMMLLTTGAAGLLLRRRRRH